MFGIAVVVAVFAGAGGYTSAAAFAPAVAPAVAAGLSLLGALIASALPRRDALARPLVGEPGGRGG
ncbi:MAG: hypothetical protein GEU88_08375 [Solirubrobacterales bacterium]|nr:hypothetical protein [Solirubrobacterales bacterium]